MPGNTRLWAGPTGGSPHFLVRVDETYVRVPVDGFTCSKKVDNLANGPIDEFSMGKVLKSTLINLGRVSDLTEYPTLMSIT